MRMQLGLGWRVQIEKLDLGERRRKNSFHFNRREGILHEGLELVIAQQGTSCLNLFSF